MSIPAQRQNTEVASGSKNAFTAYGEQASQKQIVGTLLRFTKGDYLAGQDDDEVAVGTKYVVNMDELMVGWIRWENNKPTDHIMGRVVDNYQPPRRNELGDTDKTMWEVDNQGKEKDPWQFSNYLLFWGIDDSELYTFASSSKGGLNSIGDLCKAYGKVMSQHPDEYPIIELGVSSYVHPNKEFGRIKVPVLKIVGWETKGVFADGEVTGDDDGPTTAKAAEPEKVAAGGATGTAKAADAKPAAVAAGSTAAKPATAAAPAAPGKARF
jgi:hypothetical protein